METLKEHLIQRLPVLHEKKVEIGLLLCSIVSAGVSLALLIYTSHYKTGLDYHKAPKNQSYEPLPTQQKDTGEITVDIAGAVNTPGVYTLPSDSRIDDLMKKADGLSEQANYDYFALHINRAELLHDAEKIYIPRLGEDLSQISSNPASTAISQNAADRPSQGSILNINSASESDLENLPGIGKITAQKIIDGRPYSSVEELSKNGVLKKNVFEAVKQKISV